MSGRPAVASPGVGDAIHGFSSLNNGDGTPFNRLHGKGRSTTCPSRFCKDEGGAAGSLHPFAFLLHPCCSQVKLAPLKGAPSGAVRQRTGSIRRTGAPRNLRGPARAVVPHHCNTLRNPVSLTCGPILRYRFSPPQGPPLHLVSPDGDGR